MTTYDELVGLGINKLSAYYAPIYNYPCLHSAHDWCYMLVLQPSFFFLCSSTALFVTEINKVRNSVMCSALTVNLVEI